MSEGITSYIQDIFRYIDSYEKNYDSFDMEAFLQTYNGIYAVFQALRQQRERAVEVDQDFLERIKESPLNSSDLRQMTIQILVSFFELVADTDGQSNSAYLYCRERRDVKRDVAYFEKSLIPLLTSPGVFNNNFRLNNFFLKEVGRFIGDFGSGVESDISPEDFNAMPDGRKLLELHLRRAKFGDNLFNDRDSLEFHLHSVGAFEKLRQNSPLLEKYLRDWGYLIEESFMDRVKKSAVIVWSNVKSLLSNYKYFRLALTQRNSAYVFYGLLIVLFLFLAVFVPLKWNSYSENKLIEFNNKVDVTKEAIGN